MQGFPEPVPLPDWPAPDAPLPEEEPTAELPIITARGTTAGMAGQTAGGTAAADAPAEAAQNVEPGEDAEPGENAEPGEEVAEDTPGEPAWNGPTLARAALDLALTNHRPAGKAQREEAQTEEAQPEEAQREEAQREEAQPGGGRPAEAEMVAWPAPIPASSGARPLEWSTGAFATLHDGPAHWQPPQQQARTAPQNESAGDALTMPGRRWFIGAALAAAALVLTGVAVVAVGNGGESADHRQWAPPAAAAGVSHVVTGARGGRTVAEFDLVDGARTVSLRTADLGDGLFRVSTPASQAVVPRAEDHDGRVRLRLGGDPGEVDITLSSQVRWDLRLDGGADRSTLDLSGARLEGVDLAGGATRISLRLPPPDGTLKVRMSGGVNLLEVRTAESVPVRVRVARGAGQVVLDGRTHKGVAPGGTFSSPAWDDAADRVDLDAAAGLATLTVAGV